LRYTQGIQDPAILLFVFTGLIESVGKIVSIDGSVLKVSPSEPEWASDLVEGESIAINGACLTAIEGSQPHEILFDVSPETFARTAFHTLSVGSAVNMERAMRLNERLGGHIVQGHVDAVGKVEGREDGEQFSEFRFSAPLEYDKYLIDKGSVSVDGISLTVVNPKDGIFSVWVIPTTLEKTNLLDRRSGDTVNLEFDLIAKYVEKLVGTKK
jgi:riboflavin synthase